MNYLQPTVPFNEIPVRKGSERAFDVVGALNENQLRYALCATLILLFGHPDCNATDIVIETGLPDFKPLAEAHVLLAQIGCGENCKLEVVAMSKRLEG